MNLHKTISKNIAFLLIISILSINLSFFSSPKKVDAFWGVGDVTFDPGNFGEMGWEFAKEIGLKALAAAARSLAKEFIANITAATVDWINGDFKGKPSFLTDFNKFLTGEGGVLDRTVGDFISQTGANFLCEPFKAQISMALQIGYNGFKFKKNMGCSLTSITNNVNQAIKTAGVGVNINGVNVTGNAAGNVTEGQPGSIDVAQTAEEIAWGGWDQWLQDNAVAERNPIGATILAQSELEKKVAEEKTQREKDVENGQGAMSFNTCVDIYKNSGGEEVGRSEKYVVGSGENTRPKDDMIHSGPTERECEVKTPGSTITQMLGMKATSDQRMSEIEASMADGIDAIFNALANALIKKALNQLKAGVLDNNQEINVGYSNALKGQYAQSVSNINDTLGQLNGNMQISGIVPTEFSNFNLSSASFGSTTFPYPPAVSSSTLSTGGSSFGGALDQARNNSIILINSLSRSESEYQNNYLTAENILMRARDIFASSSICNINYGRTSTVLRSTLMRANVITNIEGIPSPDRTIASIPWNLPVVRAAASSSAGHMNILSTAANGVNSAPSVSAITTAMIPVNSTNFNTDPQSTLVINIKTWLTGVQRMYNSITCPIDLTNVLRINSATSTGN